MLRKPLTFVETSVGYKYVKKYRANNNLVEQRKRRASVMLRIREYLTHPNLTRDVRTIGR